MPSLAAVNALAPSAELRPRAAEQKDEDDLMPYPLLNRFEELILHELRSPEEALARVREEFPELEAIEQYHRRFLRVAGASQWKRARIAPSFILSERTIETLELPLLSGGLEPPSDG